MLFVHLAIACSSLIITAVAFISPSRFRLRASYILVLMTIASGTYLVVSTHSPMLPSCVTGLIYTGASLIAISLAQAKLAKNEQDKD